MPLLLSLLLSATNVAVRLTQAGRPDISREEFGWVMDEPVTAVPFSQVTMTVYLMLSSPKMMENSKLAVTGSESAEGSFIITANPTESTSFAAIETIYIHRCLH